MDPLLSSGRIANSQTWNRFAFQTSGEFMQNVAALCRTAGGGSTVGSVHWLVADQLGTPRMVVDASGSLASVSRHDYLPFGEELTTQGGRTTQLGYVGDGTRQKFTHQERDNETGLDYFGARYYSSTPGRFISADPMMASGRACSPQSWNRYSYCYNNPSRFVDPDGMDIEFINQQAEDYLLYTLPDDIREKVKNAIKAGTLKRDRWLRRLIASPMQFAPPACAS